MRVRLLCGVQALKGATVKRDRNGKELEPEGGQLEHLEQGEIHELDPITARHLIGQHQAVLTEEKLTVRKAA